MLRSFSLSVVVILLLSSGVFACIGQAEAFSISALNMVQRVGGAGWAESGNLVMVGHSQKIYAVGAAAMQKETGILAQYASVYGKCGTAKVMQQASVDGRQSQLVVPGKYGFQAQGQSLAVNLNNVVRQTGAIGGTEGRQSFVGGQSQIIAVPGGISESSQFVGVSQSAAVSGDRHTNVEVKNSLDINMGQSQIATGAYAPPCYPK